MHQPCTTHAPTHARPTLPVNQNPILTPPDLEVFRLHDTAATVQEEWMPFDSANQTAQFTLAAIIHTVWRSQAREGVIIEWPLNGLFHDHCDVIIMSRMVIIRFPSNDGRYLNCRNFVILILEILAISLD